jgi:glycosyltransferase involved in cell wall biosynthesis
MNVLFISISSLPHISEHSISLDLIHEFIKHGHKVYVICSAENREKKSTSISKEAGCTVLRVNIGDYQKTNIIEKGLTMIFLPKLYISALKKYYNDVKFDLVLYPTPPVTQVETVEYIKKRDGATSYLLLKDIFPQNAVDIGIMSKGILYRYFRNKEKKLYAVSDLIGCMSQANVDYILTHNPEILKDKVEVCPNSIEPVSIIKNDEMKRVIREKYNIPNNKTIFIYGGNLGKPQGFDFLIECIKSNQTNKQVHFVIVGSGTEFNRLKSFIDREKQENVQLIKQLPKIEYDELVNSCDVGLIFLDRRFTIPNFPSRLLSYMQASIPVLAATDVNTDIGKVIEEGKFGLWCESRDVDVFNQKIQQLCNLELRRQMGVNARIYLEKHYTAKHSYEIIMKHFEGEKNV